MRPCDKMKYKPVQLILFFFAVLFSASAGHALPGSGKAIREGAEQAAARLGREGTEGVSAAMARQAERLVLRHGDEAAVLFQRFGPDAVTVVGRYGDDGVRLLSRYGNDGIAVMMRSGDEVLPLVRRYGDDVMEAAIRHPGIGEKLVAQFGADGVRMARRLPTGEAISVLRRSATSATPAASRSGRAMAFAGKHPETVLGAAAVGLLVVKPEWFQAFVSNVSKGVGQALRSGLEGLFGEAAAGWAIWVLILLVLGTVFLIYGAPRLMLAWLRGRGGAGA